MQLSVVNGKVQIAGPVLVGSPLYAAGLENRDRLLAIDGVNLASAADLTRLVGAKKPGETITLVFEGRAGRKETNVTVAENPRVDVVLFEDAGRTPTAAQLAFRTKWLATKQNP
jgi:predicted metalloprotease with PDZ domain